MSQEYVVLQHSSGPRPAAHLHRIREALQQAGESPWLVGYDANAIQELVTAGSRPIVMGGASQAITDFDEREREHRPRRNVFAGGGRGVSVVAGKARAEALARELSAEFRRCTVVGVLATAAVPLEPDNLRASLRWLRHKLDMAKDEAEPPGGLLPDSDARACMNCHRYLASHLSERDGRQEPVCHRCHVMTKQDRKSGERSISLLDVSACERDGEHRKRLAAVSADGNNLGAFFEQLETLEELAAASEVVNGIFKHANEQARQASADACRAVSGLKDVEQVPLLTGGDDVRVFLPPSGLLAYVETLAREVETGAASVSELDGLLRPTTAAALRQLGVGIGAVIAEDHFPAGQLMQYAHALERRAKSICRAPAEGTRSAFDFEIITGSQTMSEDFEHERRRGERRPFSLNHAAWQRTRQLARALRALPTTQRRVLERAPSLEPAEFGNLFCAQVARSAAWQRWYESTGIDWRDPVALIDHRPDAGLLALSSLLPEEKS